MFCAGSIEIYDVSTGESEIVKILEDLKYNKMLNISIPMLEKAINNIHSSITQVNVYTAFVNWIKCIVKFIFLGVDYSCNKSGP